MGGDSECVCGGVSLTFLFHNVNGSVYEILEMEISLISWCYCTQVEGNILECVWCVTGKISKFPILSG